MFLFNIIPVRAVCNEKSTLSRDKLCFVGTADGVEIHKLGALDV